jgi:hypothetical protein
VRTAEDRRFQVRCGQVRAPQIHRVQVESTTAALRMCEVAAAEHRQAGLHLRGSYLQLRHLVDRRRGDVLAGQSRRPRGMAADEGGHHLPDCGEVVGGVTGDPLQSVDPAQSDVEPVRAGLAELLNRTGEPLGDLALLGDLELLPSVGKLFTAICELPVGEDRTRHQGHSAKDLN